MKKLLLTICLILLTTSIAFAEEEIAADTAASLDAVTFTQDSLWGLKDKNSDTVFVEPIYKKLIPVGAHAWIVQNKRNKFGLINDKGEVLVPIKYNHTDRLVGRFAKFGNNHDYGIYDEYGKVIVKPEYSKVDILYGKMFLTYKDYKYGIVGYNGEVILENEFEDIYMPKPNAMRLKYKGDWYELEQVNAETLTLPEDALHNYDKKEGLNVYSIVMNTGVGAGYSVLTFSDYLIKLISSISPAHEDTIDELMLSQGAETVSILMKLTWIPKYPFVYIRKYYENFRNPNNGPLSEVREELRKQIK